MVQKYLAPSPATPKERTEKLHTGIKSSKGKHKDGQHNNSETEEQEEDAQEYVHSKVVHAILIAPEKANNISWYAALANKQTGTIYTGSTRALPVMPLDGNQYYSVAYDYDNNYIFVIPIAGLKDDPIMEVFDGIFT